MTRAMTPPGVRPRCCSRSSWPLKVSLTDSMTCRKGLNNGAPGRFGSPFRASRSSRMPCHCPEIDALTRHVRSFATMLTERQGERLPGWLDAVRQDDLPSLHTLAAGLERDCEAVIASLTLPWNSGVVEGHVNRIKMFKRQMFGRA